MALPAPANDDALNAALDAALLRHLPALMAELGFVGAPLPGGGCRSADGRLVVFPDGSWRWASSGAELAAAGRRGRVRRLTTVRSEPLP